MGGNEWSTSMHKEGDSVHVSEEEASGGSKDGVVRWVLVIGTLLAIVALSAIWITGALSNSDPDADNANVSARIAAEDDQAEAAGEPIPPAADETGGERSVEDGVPVIAN